MPLEGSCGQHLAWSNSCAECGNVSPPKKHGPDRSWQMQSVRRNGTDGRLQHEAPCKEELELVRHSTDLRIEGVLMRRANCAEKSGDWENYLEEFLGNGKLSIRASAGYF